MKVAEFKETIEKNLEENPYYLDGIDEYVTCKGGSDVINDLLVGAGFPPLREELIDQFLWRAWVFTAELEDGSFTFLGWDIGNGALSYYSEFTHKSITDEFNRIRLTSPYQDCLNCGTQNVVNLQNVSIDEDGPFTVCVLCEGSFDIPDELYESLKSQQVKEAK